MSKYTEEFKIKLVTEYLNTNLGYKLLASKYGMPSSSPLKQWVRTYKSLGIEGLKRKSGKETYTVQFKLDTVKFMLETGASFQETANQFKMNNPALIYSWRKAFNEQGIEGLKLKLKRRPSMTKKPRKSKKSEEKDLTREKALERENELLRLEVAYLKKLRTFRENQKKLHEKYKPNGHSSSSKMDSD